ncbi:MAG: DNA translocase FtsK [Thermoflexales bacterium]|nr:DNA translocase FtsK [Thermoflexales bacterium]
MTKRSSSSRSKTRSRRSSAPGRSLQVKLTLDQKLDILGVVLILGGILTLGSQLSFSQGSLTGPYLQFLAQLTGWGAYSVPLIMIVTGVWLVLRKFESVPRPSSEQVVGFCLVYVAVLCVLQAAAMWAFRATPQAVIEAGSGGGRLGEGVRLLLVGGLGQLGAALVLAVTLAAGLLLLFKIPPSHIANLAASAWAWLRSLRKPQAEPAIEDGEWPASRAPFSRPGPAPAEASYPTPRPDKPAHVIGGDGALSLPPASPAYRLLPAGQVWELPTIGEVFEPGNESALSEEDIRTKANIIEETLHSLGVEGRVVEVNRGPVVTQFGIEPGFITTRNGKQTKVKVSKITALTDDLALALAAKTIRIEAPVPGRSIVGIEVPNSEVSLVSLLDVIDSESFQKSKSMLRIALGQDVSGQAVMADLATMPHLLIAGTTGSGKSVCVNAIIACLLAYNTPDDLRFIMVDPKRVELTSYNNIPHLLEPVVVDLERVVATLQMVTREMDGRYRKFAQLGVRNIDDLNARVTAHTVEGERKMPYIVVIIDELADLMMLAPDETEKTICRLAQMARATGIHLIIATQRPSVDVVTGLIKANFPARISFAVASSVDSRVILDVPGAERLLGRGDMLFVSPDSGLPLRLQGCFVSDHELQRLTRYWKGVRGVDTGEALPPASSAPVLVQQPLWDELRASLDRGEQPPGSATEDDVLYEQAAEIVRMQKKASISMLQRRLRIGYTRAARLIDQMEQRGLVGPSEPGSRWREVLVDESGRV